MVTRARALFDRLGPWPAFAAFSVVGAAAWAVALATLVPLARAIAGGAPLITLSARDAIGLPIGLTFFALAAITLSPPPNTAKTRRESAARNGRRRVDWPVFCLWVAAAGIAMTFVATGLTEMLVTSAVDRRGYTACPALDGERPAHLRWTRAAARRCPCSWREAG